MTSPQKMKVAFERNLDELLVYVEVRRRMKTFTESISIEALLGITRAGLSINRAYDFSLLMMSLHQISLILLWSLHLMSV